MKRIIVTNNKKVEAMYSDKVEVIYLDGSSALKVLEEGKQVAEEGGHLLLDPTRYKGYYRSLAFFKDEDRVMPEGKSLSMLDRSIEEAKGAKEKEPVLAGIFQNRDLDVIKKILS
jgi:hypothetical protein